MGKWRHLDLSAAEWLSWDLNQVWFPYCCSTPWSCCPWMESVSPGSVQPLENRVLGDPWPCRCGFAFPRKPCLQDLEIVTGKGNDSTPVTQLHRGRATPLHRAGTPGPGPLPCASLAQSHFLCSPWAPELRCSNLPSPWGSCVPCRVSVPDILLYFFSSQSFWFLNLPRLQMSAGHSTQVASPILCKIHISLPHLSPSSRVVPASLWPLSPSSAHTRLPPSCPMAQADAFFPPSQREVRFSPLTPGVPTPSHLPLSGGHSCCQTGPEFPASHSVSSACQPLFHLRYF